MDMMRVGGLASGMDIEGMVKKLMEAERMPLTRLQQQQTQLTWKRDAFRDVNSKLLALDEMMFDMKLSKSYKPKSAASSQDGSITATADSGATNGTYNINVEKLATNEMWVSDEGKVAADIEIDQGEYKFSTFDEEGNEMKHKVTVEEGDSLKTVLKNIGTASDGKVRAFYNESSKQVVLETTRTGVYNENGPEIVFGGLEAGDGTSVDFFTNTLGFPKNDSNAGPDSEGFKAATNAAFTYNDGLTIKSKSNSYSLNGVHFEFNNVTDGNARVTVSSNVEESFDTIIDFVEKYNEAIDMMNLSQTEEKFRDYKPLTDEQKAEMSDKQIEQWEEKAKSGILRGETAIRNGMFTLRQSMQSVVETDGEYELLSQIGISTTKNWMDGGKLEIDEAKLKTALRENPDDVFKLFSNSEEGAERGLINRFDDALDQVKGQIETKAGKSTHTLENYSIGKQMKQLDERITDFEKKMMQVEQRYWNQFTQMEKAISKLNQQADYLYSQFNG